MCTLSKGERIKGVELISVRGKKYPRKKFSWNVVQNVQYFLSILQLRIG